MDSRVVILLALCCLATCGKHDGHDHDGHHHHDNKNDAKDVRIEDLLASGDYHGKEVLKSNEAHIYIERLFHKYGEQGIMTFEGFEHLLQSLGIGQVGIDDHDIHDHYSETGFVEFHENHKHTVKNTTTQLDYHSDHHDNDDDDLASSGELDVVMEEGHDSQGHTHHDHHHDSHHHDLDESTETFAAAQQTQNNIQSPKTTRSKNKKTQKSSALDAGRGHDGEGHILMSPDEEVKGRVKRASPDSQYLNPDVPDARKLTMWLIPHHLKNVQIIRLPYHQCLTPTEILSTYHITYNVGITEDNFLHLCPAIVYQIDAHTCSQEEYHALMCQELHNDKGSHCQQYHSKPSYGAANLSMRATVKRDIMDIPPKVWLYASGAVTLISLVGLFCVAIIPVMQRVFYHHLIQFLVALAIGSLTGDALLHLLPHALSNVESGGSHDHGEVEGHSHDLDDIYKGSAVLAGIYFFFIMERFMDSFTQWKKNRRKTRTRRKSFKTQDDLIGEKLSRYNSSGRSSENLHFQLQNKTDAQRLVEESMHDSTLDTYDELELYEIDDGNHGNSHHGHSHGDGKVPKTVAAMAWMVIMGDGLHNLSDGLAIGASFANSITGGLSTTIAVFCHELPHELGDFAVLLRAGMTVKQALFYNIVSSVLSFLGMIIGVALGNIESASLWIFALTAGMFIYISLVDMLPEITGPVPPGDSRCCLFILHILGITAGITVMMMIALYEDQIKLSIEP